MKQNPLRQLQSFGQSVWLDDLDRQMLAGGELQALIEEDGLSGVTSNPKIFSDAIQGSTLYDDTIRRLAGEGLEPQEIYREIAAEDIGQAADLLRPVWKRRAAGDGFVSLEVSPHLAYNTEETVTEARELWARVNRPNVFIKVPATREGLRAIRQLITEGIHVNVTLLFGLDRYREVAEAYLAGLEARLAAGQPVDNVSSVASFFLSRIDVLLDPQLEKLGEAGKRLRGEIAIASAKVAYRMYREITSEGRFQRLAEQGARPQKLLWGSTGTKNPDDSDVKYVEPLIGPDTINTMPRKTLDAYRDHGMPEARLTEGLVEAEQKLRQLADLGIDLRAVSDQLESEGVKKFEEPFHTLLEALGEKRSMTAR